MTSPKPSKKVLPSRSILDPKFKYSSSFYTDIRKTFRKFRLLKYLQDQKA